jgi:Protein tyrosine and serine/threonine kinase
VLLPAGIDFVVDVSVFADFEVRVQLDRLVYIVTFCLSIGLNEARYQEAIRYASDLILDNLLRRPPLYTPTQLKATTSFPSQSDLVQPQLVAVGATADIYRAHQSSVQREVAVKVFRDRTEATMAAAISEGSILTAVNHHAIPGLIALCGLHSPVEEELPYLIVEWRNGRALSDPNCLHYFLNLPYNERVRHFVEICMGDIFHAFGWNTSWWQHHVRCRQEPHYCN